MLVINSNFYQIILDQATNLKLIFKLVACAILIFCQAVSAKTYMTQEQFLSKLKKDAYKEYQLNTKVISKTLWLNKTIQLEIKSILDHSYPKLRIRYKRIEDQSQILEPITVWFLEEIGKERAISFAIAIKSSQVVTIQVLEFRESRGGEISIPTFAKQFKKLSLNSNGNLNRTIDGITGATMSVHAMKKITRMALMLHKHVTITNS
ncbi:MAG: hypothetical protein COA86_13640 [Kangiella sp.]|nr:MAG: hypothetical protein COA86_13640 [Kangiella sp.]